MFSARIREDVELRLLEEHHAPALFAAVDRERNHLRPWLPWVDATRTVDDSLAFIKSSLEQFATHYGFAAGIWCGGVLAGTIGMHRIDWMNRRVELGYWLAREFEGRGIMTDACRAVTTHCFQDLGLHRVEIRCAVENVKSAAVPRRLGFQLEATLREANLLGGVYHDLHIFAMLKKEWNSL
jgi:ribosomal-protein-serine acetyltransferase